jgi:cytoskeletal protein RodZ
MTVSGLFKFVIGVSLAIALLVGSGVLATQYLITRLTSPPPKPIFPEELPNQTTSSESSTTADTPQSTEPSPSPSPEPQASPDELDPNVYQARVVQPIGLVLRQGPSTETTRVGGVEYNAEVIVLGESSDGEWINIRLPGSGVEGWVKAGNTESLN